MMQFVLIGVFVISIFYSGVLFLNFLIGLNENERQMFEKHICSNCRWWEEHNSYEGFCRLSGSNIYWMEQYWKVKPRNNNSRPEVWAKHDEVRTSPNFGCNQWEKR